MEDEINLDKLIKLHNEARDKGSWVWDIMPLTKNDKLMEYAQQWADRMANTNRMYHSRMKDIMKLGFATAGENIAWGQTDVETVMKTWLHSPGHRANIMSTRYDSIGCGVAKTAKGRLYWCVCFGQVK